MKKWSAGFILLCSYLIPNDSFAHAEHDKARFVSSEGTDIGQCDNVLRPCKTIAYAVSRANKGDKVLVSAGNYPVNSTDELFFFSSDIVPIKGGYNRFDHFQSQSPNSNVTTLTGVPLELAGNLRQSGFTVVTDGKSINNNKELADKFSAYTQLNQAQSNVPCENNKAGNYECNNIDLLSHMPLSDFSGSPTAANDIWGHVDLNSGNEYAIIGLNNGVAVVDITDPTLPVEVGTISGQVTTWRDVKVYQYYDDEIGLWRAYAYATIDGNADFVSVIDLNHLPSSISLIKKDIAAATAHNVYISNVDHALNIALPGETASLQLLGTNKYFGAFNSYSLSEPETLIPLSPTSSIGEGYTHDGASLTITDDRKTTDCKTNGESCTVFLDFNEKEIKLWNITNADQVTQLGQAEYNDVAKAAQYVHSGWGSEDQQYIFVHDEFDEYRGGLNSTVRIFSIADLTNPQQVGQWTGETSAIDHNGFVRGNRYYMSNYTRGLTVLDITDAANPVEVGNFDTYSSSNSNNFHGAWGTYPYLPSGNIIVSDINSGLYVLQDNTLSNDQGELSFSAPSINAMQGENVTISIMRNNAVNDSQGINVGYEILPGSASNNDFIAESGRLTWAENDNTDKTISIAINDAESSGELAESFYIRLFDPKNGATLKAPSYITVNIDGAVNKGALSFTQSSVTVAENQPTVDIEVSRDGSTSGNISVAYQLESGNAIVGEDINTASGTLTWEDGDGDTKTIKLTIINDDIEEIDEYVQLKLTAVDNSQLGAISVINITIADDDSNTAPVITIGENFEVNTSQTVTLSATATDAENDTLNYLWTQTDGTTVALDDATKATTTFVAPSSAEVLTFSLTVTDIKGAQTVSSISVTIVAPVPTPTTPDNGNTTNTSSGGGGGGSMYMLLLLLALRPLVKNNVTRKLLNKVL